jgi:hypothetical protein
MRDLAFAGGHTVPAHAQPVVPLGAADLRPSAVPWLECSPRRSRVRRFGAGPAASDDPGCTNGDRNASAAGPKRHTQHRASGYSPVRPARTPSGWPNLGGAGYTPFALSLQRGAAAAAARTKYGSRHRACGYTPARAARAPCDRLNGGGAAAAGRNLRRSVRARAYGRTRLKLSHAAARVPRHSRGPCVGARPLPRAETCGGLRALAGTDELGWSCRMRRRGLHAMCAGSDA